MRVGYVMGPDWSPLVNLGSGLRSSASSLRIVGLVIIALSMPAAGSLAQSYTFDPPADVPGPGGFGYDVALDGNFALIGEAFNNGLVHLYDVTTRTRLYTFPESGGPVGDSLGTSIALGNNYALLGAPVNSVNGFNAGRVHLYDITTGSLLRSFDEPTPGEFNYFGSAVAIDAGHLLISAPGEHPNPLNLGHAYVFDAATGSLLRTFTDPTPTALSYDDFGSALDLDGSLVAIGEAGDGLGNGSVHLFDLTTGALLRTFTDPTPTGRGNFGRALALDGGRLVVGEIDNLYEWEDQVGHAYLFDAVSGALLTTFDDPTPTEDDWFGDSVAIQGERVLVGARFDDTNGQNIGQAHLFDADTGSLLRTFDDPTITAFDDFGSSVAIDGDWVLIGAHSDSSNSRYGQAHLFQVPEPPSAMLLLVGCLITAFGARWRQT